MSITLGLRLGESFAEVVASRGTQTTFQQRWYLPKLSLKDGLKAALETFKAQDLSSNKNRLILSSSRAEQILRRRLGESPAFITTSGFESRLAFQAPIASTAFALRSERAWTPFESRRSFGVNERVDASGKVVRELKIDELQEIAAKLELLKVKSVAIGFLHSDLNPSHEDQAANFLREKGFHVVVSHDVTAPEGERWLRTLEEAYIAEPLKESFVEIDATLREVLGENHSKWDIQIWTQNGPEAFDLEALSNSKNLANANLRAGHRASLEAMAATAPENVVLHLGLEGFCAFGKTAKQTAGASTRLLRSFTLPVHATNTVEIGDWSVPKFSAEAKGFEPGPMIFGKAHHLTPMDLLSICGHLEVSSEITELINEKSTGRILEALYTFGKMIPMESDKESADSKDVAQALETAWVETIVSTLVRLQPKTVRVTGALAKSLVPLLSKRRPDWSFATGAEMEQAEAFATASIPMAAALSATTAKIVAQPQDPALMSKSATKTPGRVATRAGSSFSSSSTASRTSTSSMPGSRSTTSTSSGAGTAKPGMKTVTRTVVKTVTRGGGTK